MNANDMIAVTLSAQQWQAVMAMLAKQPYEVCAQFIQAIQSQCMSHEVAGVQGAQRVPN
jgi:hypothetical protein